MKNRKPPPRNAAYSRLVQKVCVGMGFCGCVKDGEPLHVNDFIPASGLVAADQFVDWLILADDLDPRFADRATKRAIREAFVEHMGTDVIDAAKLK